MKHTKILALLLALCLTMTLLVGCNSNKKEEEIFDKSEEAFQKITEAYMMINTYSQDIYNAWRLGINNKSRYDEGGSELKAFAGELHIDYESVALAIGSLLGKDSYESGYWENLQKLYNGSFFSACVDVVSEAYVVDGTVKKISNLLTEAKTLMKEIGDEYSDYVHYPDLKEYFTNTLAFFDFCQNPEGSFEQVVETFNNYRNTAREKFFDLNYIFEDSIDGMNVQRKIF